MVTATGGQGGGGATLTDTGRHVLRVYRDVCVVQAEDGRALALAETMMVSQAG